ncbi:MAG: hypothetical protein M3Y39_22500 [Chloroflexota bacterium]|nr:hypothetical protein [Chloroflexota bacterium]
MKLDITSDLQSSNVLELNDAELAAVSGGHRGDWGGHDGGDHGWHHWGGDHDHWHRWWGHRDWQDSDCFGGYNSQQVFFVDQQSSPCVVIPSYCGY